MGAFLVLEIGSTPYGSVAARFGATLLHTFRFSVYEYV